MYREFCWIRFSVSVELLNAETVIPYLLNRGIITNTEGLIVEELSGGVSNVVLAVQNSQVDLVLKQALAELKVQTKWVADQRRAIVEANAVRLFHSISPKQVPRLIDSDPDLFTLVIERAPHTSKVWKTELLSGRINPRIGFDLGKTLASWHNFGEGNKSVQEQFSEDSLFDQLRIDPFYREIRAKNPELFQEISSLITELQEDKSTIVHGDFSPKNFLVNNDKDVYILDFEVTHFGNPIFDQAFTLAHLLCKFFRTNSQVEEGALRETASQFLTGYETLRKPTSLTSLAGHTAALALARVEGKSRVDYLALEAQDQIKQRTKSALANLAEIHPLDLYNKEFL